MVDNFWKKSCLLFQNHFISIDIVTSLFLVPLSGAPLIKGNGEVYELSYWNEQVTKFWRSFITSLDFILLLNNFREIIAYEYESLKLVGFSTTHKDPANQYKSGSKLIDTCDKYLHPFLIKYVEFNNIGKVSEHRKFGLYRSIYKLVRPLLYKDFRVSFDVYRGFCVYYENENLLKARSKTLLLSIAESLYQGSIEEDNAVSGVPILHNFFGHSDILYVSEVLWNTFFENSPYPKFTKRFLSIRWFKNTQMYSFTVVWGPFIWINEACKKHANVDFFNSYTMDSILVTDEFSTTRAWQLMPTRALNYGDELLLLSINSSVNNLEDVSKEDHSKFDVELLNSETQEIFIVSELKNLKWAGFEFVLNDIPADNNCYYHSLFKSFKTIECLNSVFSICDDVIAFKEKLLEVLMELFLKSSVEEQTFISLLCFTHSKNLTEFNASGVDYFKSVLEYYKQHGEWGGEVISMLITYFLSIHVITLNALDESFQLSSDLIFNSSFNYRESFIRNKWKNIRCSELPIIFLLNCSCAYPYLAGSELRYKVGNQFRPDHYSLLTPKEKIRSSVDILNQAYSYYEIVKESKFDKNSRKREMEYKCDPLRCSFYNYTSIQE